MANATDYLENAALNHVFGKGAHNMTSPANLYVGLASAVTGLEAGTFGSELQDGLSLFGYARVTVAFRDDDGTALPTTTGGIENDATVRFTASGGDWETATHWFIADSSTYQSGNILAWGAMNSSAVVLDGQNLDFEAGSIRVVLA